MTATWALDVGGSHIAGAVVAEGRVVARDELPVRQPALLGDLLEPLADLLSRAAVAAGVRPARLGMAFPGIVDPFSGTVLSTPRDKYADSPALDLQNWARDRLGADLRIDGDARVAMLGEWRHGALRGTGDAVLITLGTGIGSAVLSDGRPLRGRHFQAGVLGGHLSTAPDGPPCICGNRGCSETEASTWALPAIVGRLAPDRSDLAERGLAGLFARARGGDEAARAIRRHMLGAWGAVVVNMIHAHDPERVAIGGGAIGSAADILPALRDHVRRHAWTGWGTPELVAAELGADAALLGAGALWADA